MPLVNLTVLNFNQMTWISVNEPVSALDLNGNDRIDFADIVALFNEILSIISHHFFSRS
jgi:hypothetical protein